MKRFLIADDHPAIRSGVKAVLKKEFSETEFGEANDAVEIFRLLKEKKWYVIILDMDMPGRSGLEVLIQMKSEGVKIPVLMFSMHPEEVAGVRAIRSGAQGYLSKESAGEELGQAVQAVLSGRKYITQKVAEQLAMQVENPQNKAPHELLSDREYQTLMLFAKGKTVSEIADELSLSTHTISTYRTRILEKMGMKTNAELVKYAVSNKLA